MKITLNDEDYKKIRTNRQNQLIQWRLITDKIWIIFATIGCIFMLGLSSPWWLKIIGLMSVSHSSLQIGSRIWKIDDYMEGYEDGLSDGVNRTLLYIDKQSNPEKYLPNKQDKDFPFKIDGEIIQE